MNAPKKLSLQSRQPLVINEDDGVAVPRRRCMSMPTTLLDIMGIMKCRTLDESLHSKYGSESAPGSRNAEKGTNRGIQFNKIVIREYARTIGDNPSCSSGPPVSISWEYNQLGIISLEEYENTRPPRRSHFEMVLPRKVRQDMLKREWDVSQRQIADSVRNNVKVKSQRIATVNNLGKATKLEEAMESASRKLKRLITFQKPVSQQVKDLEAKVNEANRRKSQLKLELNMAGEYSDGSDSDTREETPEAIDTSASSST